MNLKAYIAKKGLKAKWFAEQVEIEEGRFYKILNGLYEITLHEAMKVKDFTNGEVDYEDHLQQHREGKAVTGNEN